LTERRHLSDEIVAELATPGSGECRVWDITIKGFCVRIHPSGRKVFCLKHMVDGRSRWTTLGAFRSPWTAEIARARVAEILRRAPVKPSARRFPGDSLTVSDLIKRYLTEGPSTKLNKRESSWRGDESNLRCHVAPLIGAINLEDLTRDHIVRMVFDTINGKTAARRATGRQGGVSVRGGAGCAHVVYRTTRAMFYWAIERELMERNPATGIELPRRPMVGRFLTLEEAKHMLVKLAGLEGIGEVNPQHGAAIRLLLYTGARRSEICGLHWAEIDYEHRRLVLPPERCKTGGKTGERRIPLNQPSLKILAELPRRGALVFPAERSNVRGHMTGLDKSWKRLRATAGLGSLRLHDLRHSFASFALANGENIVSIGAVLGHSGTRTTQRYLHLHDTSGADMSERTARLFG